MEELLAVNPLCKPCFQWRQGGHATKTEFKT